MAQAAGEVKDAQFSGYGVSADGYAWTRKNGRYGLRETWTRLSEAVDSAGYRTVAVMVGGKAKTMKIARLVLLTFVGQPTPRQEVLHCNGIRTDDRLHNLRWGTRAENMADCKRHGTFAHGDRNGQRVMTAAIVREMRARYAAGESYRAIQRAYGFKYSTIYHAVKGASWKQV